jgi:hypothetical protein
MSTGAQLSNILDSMWCDERVSSQESISLCAHFILIDSALHLYPVEMSEGA